MRESINSGIKEYRPMKSEHRKAVPLAYLVKLWMEGMNPNRLHCSWLGGSAGMSLRDAEMGLQVLRGGQISLEHCYHSRRLQTPWQEHWASWASCRQRTTPPLCHPVHMAGGEKGLKMKHCASDECEGEAVSSDNGNGLYST
ncbi:hypothetical protein NQZ68_003879 [Dissostichus eleginoides]|nr:hypothetical protein NQZ68_003879 [Dissostichus eleginoides]